MTDLKSSTSISTPRDPLKEDFRNFLYVVWKHLNLPDPTPVQYDIAWFLQHGPKRFVIEAFRGVGKSWITSAFVVWLLFCNPQLNILVVSASKLRADEFSTFTLRLIMEMELLAHLRPKDGQRQSKISFDVAPAQADHAPSVKSVGITGQIAGSRADVIIADDIEIPNNSATQTMRDKLSEQVKEFDAVVKPGGRIGFLGTPQTEQSLYNKLPERGYVVRVWPARYPQEKVLAALGTRFAPALAEQLAREADLAVMPGDPTRGQPTDPLRFTHDDLMERELSYGRSGFALQFMLDTTLSDAERYPLKVRDLIVMDLNPQKAPAEIVWAAAPDLIWEDLPNVAMSGDHFYRPMTYSKDDWLPYTGSVMFVDPSGRGKDETGYAVVKILHGVLYVTACGGLKGGYEPEDLRALLRIAKTQSVNLILVEPNFGDGMFANLLRAQVQTDYKVTVEDAEWSRTMKEQRIIDTLEPVLNQHRLVIDRGVIEQDYRSTESYPAEQVNNYRLIFQMTRITRDKGAILHDDRLDALAGAVAYWQEQMARNVQKAQKAHRDELQDAELRRFMRAAGSTAGTKNKSWLPKPGYHA